MRLLLVVAVLLSSVRPAAACELPESFVDLEVPSELAECGEPVEIRSVALTVMGPDTASCAGLMRISMQVECEACLVRLRSIDGEGREQAFLGWSAPVQVRDHGLSVGLSKDAKVVVVQRLDLANGCISAPRTVELDGLPVSEHHEPTLAGSSTTRWWWLMGGLFVVLVFAALAIARVRRAA